MNLKRIFMLLAAALLVCCMLCAVACDGGQTETPTTGEPQGDVTTVPTTDEVTTEAQTDDGKVTYTVTVVDANGAPVKDVAVQFCDDNGCRMPVATNTEGVVTLTDLESNFHVTLASVPAGYAADTTEYYFDGELSLTITLQAE